MPVWLLTLLSRFRRRWVLISLLLLVTAAVFSRVPAAGFITAWDDGVSITENLHIRGLDPQRLEWMLSNVSYVARYKPLGWLSYALIYSAAGLNPLVYHAASLGFHCLNVGLLCWLLRLVLRRDMVKPEAEGDTSSLAWCAGLGALAWGVHPLRVEAVAWATDLAYCQSLFFLLVSLWCYLQANLGPERALSRRGFYWGAVGAFALSMLSYPFPFAYVVVLAVLDVYPLRRFNPGGDGWRSPLVRRILLEKLPFAVLGGLILLTFLGRVESTGVWADSQPWSGLTPWGKAMQAFYIWAYYVWKPLIPIHLSPVYTTLVAFNPWGWRFVLSAGAVIGLTVVLIWRRRQWPWALALWICHLVLLVPALGLSEYPHFPSDRYSYMPGILWGAVMAAALYRLSHQPRRFAWGVVGALLLISVLGIKSFQQTRMWRDSISLFEQILADLGDDPFRAGIHWRLGQAYFLQQRLDEAVEQYRLTLALQSKLPAHYFLAQALQAQGKFDEALEHYAEVLRRLPHAEVHVSVAELLRQRGEVKQAIAHYREAVRLQPDLWPALNNLAWILATDPDPANRNGAEAVQFAEQACGLTGYSEAMLVGTLGAAYAEAGRFSEAALTADRAAGLAEKANHAEWASRNRQLAEVYRGGRPYHEPSRSPGSGPRTN